MTDRMEYDYDYVVGSGFGGSVSASVIKERL
jgi:choline dehydrogenase-like flavoprotein